MASAPISASMPARSRRMSRLASSMKYVPMRLPTPRDPECSILLTIAGSAGAAGILRDKAAIFATIGPNGDANKSSMRVLTIPKQQRTIGLREIKDKIRTITAEEADQFVQPLPGTAMTLQERAYTAPIWYTP